MQDLCIHVAFIKKMTKCQIDNYDWLTVYNKIVNSTCRALSSRVDVFFRSYLLQRMCTNENGAAMGIWAVVCKRFVGEVG